MTSRVRRLAPWLLLLAALVVAGLVLPGGDDSGAPLDPRSTGALGTKALVDVLDRLGAEVTVTTQVGDADTVLLLQDLVTEQQREALRGWVRDGGRLVVADPASPFAPEVAGVTGIGPLDPSIAADCPLPALADVDRVAVGGGLVYETDGAAGAACFRRNEGAWLVVRPLGDGVVMSLGGPVAFTNGQFGDLDNARLAVALLAPTADERVAVIEPAPVGEGQQGLLDLVDPRVWWALGQLAVGFVLYAWYRARRLGPPVSEPLPVAVPGSEFTLAVGRLWQERRDTGRAADQLRQRLAHELARRTGLGPSASPDQVAAAVRSGAVRGGDDLASVLEAPDPGTEGALVDYARRVERARATVGATPTTRQDGD